MLHGSLVVLLLQSATADLDAPARLEVVEVRSTATQDTQASIAGLSSLDEEQIALDGLTHPNELFDRVPGAWISRGSGQESLSAIRSPVLTGPGACGAFMVMEDGVPIRPAGFCNVNELFELNLLQAQRIEVIRGPGSVIYGSNALHGVIDASSADPRPEAFVNGGLEAGTDDYYRARLSLSSDTLRLSTNYTSSRSFRVDEGYEHAFANGAWMSSVGSADVRTQFSWADLDQDTAGFILGKDAYQDPVLRRENLNPEAFRDAQAFRLTSRWTWAPSPNNRFELIPYVRSSDMDFLQHFLPGKPLERNGQDSMGALFTWSPGSSWTVGADLEWADGHLVEFQENPTQGSDFLVETRPQGFHYDYDVTMSMAAAWAQVQHDVSEQFTVTAGLRAETLHYRYRNNMLNGNTRDDGTPCGFGGCLYTRPADRTDRFNNLAPELGMNWQWRPGVTVFSRLARGFRVPQATELYRLQRGQTVADLEAETLDTLEIGLRGTTQALAWDVTTFVMRKDSVIFRDANGFNVSNGKTDHQGWEATLDWAMSDRWRLGGNVSWARHEYAFDRPASGIVQGNDVDTAPRWLGGLRLRYGPPSAWSAEAEWVHQGGYYLDPANAHRYEGHDLFHLRVFFRLPDVRHQLALRVTNLLDDAYAERADFAFGNYRYFPGAGRRLFIEWRYSP